MKANEFQIGDWVQWNFDVEPKQRQIFSITTEEDSDGNKEYYADLGDGEIYKDLIPIPLTAEIIEKNGITLLEVGDDGIATPKSQRNRYEKWFIHTKFVDTYLWYDRLSMRWHLHNMSGAKFKHVHELQHALRLCGLNDLADNFKI